MRKTTARTLWLTKRDAANEARVGTRTIERWIAEGTLPAFRMGGQVRIKATDLDKLARPIAPTAVAR